MLFSFHKNAIVNYLVSRLNPPIHKKKLLLLALHANFFIIDCKINSEQKSFRKFNKLLYCTVLYYF